MDQKYPIMTHIDLTNKNILVTGASNGIGKAIAEYLIKMGARVAIHYHSSQENAKQLENSCSHGSKTFQADLSKESDVYDLFENVLTDFKTLDAIVLNAGVFLEHSTDLETSDWMSIWKKTLDINLNSVGLLTKLGIDHYKEINGGRFIYIGSRAVFRGETEEYLAYAASKGGLTSLARSVARSFGKQNIKSFVVSPGFTRTQMAEQFIEAYGEERVLNEISLNELTKPEDLAPLVAMLCCGLMDHATGATIDVNAGSHIR
jgi:NAD(P)-dependent dehydrogenase (short-subunit alcohol dehydrogenase family)